MIYLFKRQHLTKKIISVFVKAFCKLDNEIMRGFSTTELQRKYDNISLRKFIIGK